MRHNVTVVDGLAAKDVTVYITDGATPGEYRFVPENIVVGKGSKVTYANVGAQPHTATALGAQEPALQLLPLKAENGTIKIEGEGWLRVLAITQDSEGRLGIANKSIYATATLPAFAQQTLTYEFTHGTPGPLAGTPAEASGDAKPITLEHPGKVTLNYTFSDALGGAGAPENLAEIAIHFTKDGETQDTLTAGPAPVGTAEGKAIAGAYTLTVIPVQGAQVSGTIVVDVVYDLVPPPVGPAAPPADGHGGHAH
jgi:plastocyanin